MRDLLWRPNYLMTFDNDRAAMQMDFKCDFAHGLWDKRRGSNISEVNTGVFKATTMMLLILNESDRALKVSSLCSTNKQRQKTMRCDNKNKFETLLSYRIAKSNNVFWRRLFTTFIWYFNENDIKVFAELKHWHSLISTSQQSSWTGLFPRRHLDHRSSFYTDKNYTDQLSLNR